MAIPLFGHALKSIKMIDIDRSSGTSAVKQVIEKGTERLRDGLWVSIFPEGTRMMYGRTRRFGKSGALLAKEAGVPLVVIAHNAGEFWGKKTLMVNPGKIKVIIGEPIMPDGKSADEMLEQASTWMETTMRENFPEYKKLADYYAGLQLDDDGGNFQTKKSS
ncbi:MAG: 1-acyl-sn-glycerol-3-phosphate acyltransferase [Gammaproteobacteria bacterium]|nr:1-acyl-sn-glycerol-3-phosphate acyltransferase [Gammaproteobacteria bacterium]